MDEFSLDTSAAWMYDVFPEASLGLPLKAAQQATTDLENPFTDGLIMRHPGLRKDAYNTETEGVNGYIKFRLQAADFDCEPSSSVRIFDQTTPSNHSRKPILGPLDLVPRLPPDFGKGLKLDKMDAKLLTFCRFGSISFDVFVQRMY